MALIRPVLATPPAFDATKEYTFTFSVGSGGDQVVGNQLTIIKQETNDIVYRKSITSFAFSHTIPENTLVNGEYYSAYVFTTNSNGENSSASNSVQFYCFSTPSFEFYNMPVDFIIQNSSYLFRVKYEQAEEESLNSYIFNLYDTQRILISTSGTKYIGSLVKPPNIVEHQFGGLVDNSAYYIEAVGRTVNNTEIKTELISFVVKYSTPNIFTVVQLTNNCQGGYITVKSNLTSIEGESNPTPPVFVDDNTAIDLTGDGSYVIWKEGFAIPNDFTASLWGRSFNKDSTIITMRSKLLGDTLTINYREDDANKVYVELIAAKGTACYYIYSDKIDKPSPTDKVQIWLRRISNLYAIGIYNLGTGGCVTLFVLCGYDFCSDKNALTEPPVQATRYDEVTLSNGIFDHWNVSEDVSKPYSSEIPTIWDLLTVMNANFNGNINAGNIDYSLSEINGFKIKRRKTTEFDWVTLKYIPIKDLDDLSFVFNDNLAASGYDYEYAFVPVIGDIEGDYISNTIGSKFEGVFICDQDTIYKFFAGVRYGTNQKVQKIGVFEPYGRKYPVIVSNGLVSYETGSLSGTVLPSDYMKTNKMDRLKITEEKKALFEFLVNKKAKILKDWNGSSWLICITGNPSAEYDSEYGMGKIDVSAEWAEVGNPENQKDLYRNGMVNEVS